MAIARKCDLCGECYESYDMALDQNEAMKKHNGFVFVSINDRRQWYNGKVMDCCPSCLASIKNYIDTLRKDI